MGELQEMGKVVEEGTREARETMKTVTHSFLVKVKVRTDTEYKISNRDAADYLRDSMQARVIVPPVVTVKPIKLVEGGR